MNTAAVASPPLPRPRSLELRKTGVPRLGLALICLLAAGIDVRTRDVGLGGPASNPLEVVMLLVFLITMADSVVAPRQVSLMLRAAWRSNAWLTTYFAWAFVAGFAGIMQLALSLFVFRNLLPAFVFFVLLVHSARHADDLKRTFIVFLVAAIPNVALGLCQRVFGKPFPVPLNAASAVKMDVDGSFVSAAVSGLFNHPNGLSIFLLPVVLVSFGLLFSRVRLGWWLRIGTFLMLLASLALLYFTRAKGAWAWTLFGMSLLMVPRGLLAFRGGWVALVSVVVGLITAMTLVSLRLGGSLQTMMTRVLLWKSTLHAMADSWFLTLLGSGQELVWNASARISDLQYANAHNVFLNQVVYFGLPAAVFYIASFVLGVRRGHAALRGSADPEVRRYGHIVIAVLLSMAGQYFFEPAAESSGLAVTCFLFMGVAAVAARLGRE